MIDMMNRPQLPKGHTSILSPAFKYVPAASTDLAKTFARLREQQHRSPARGTANIAVLKQRSPAS
jgi:hypothetical protein